MWYIHDMTIAERIRESEQKFEEKKTSREEHLRLAEEDLTEMTKLQGEWRLLQDLQAEEAQQAEKSKVNKKATVVEAVPEGETI